MFQECFVYVLVFACVGTRAYVFMWCGNQRLTTGVILQHCLFWLLFLFPPPPQDRIPLCSPGHPGPVSVDQAGFEFGDLPTCLCLLNTGIKEMSHHHQVFFFFFKELSISYMHIMCFDYPRLHLLLPAFLSPALSFPNFMYSFLNHFCALSNVHATLVFEIRSLPDLAASIP